MLRYSKKRQIMSKLFLHLYFTLIKNKHNFKNKFKKILKTKTFWPQINN